MVVSRTCAPWPRRLPGQGAPTASTSRPPPESSTACARDMQYPRRPSRTPRPGSELPLTHDTNAVDRLDRLLQAGGLRPRHRLLAGSGAPMPRADAGAEDPLRTSASSASPTGGHRQQPPQAADSAGISWQSPGRARRRRRGAGLRLDRGGRCAATTARRHRRARGPTTSPTARAGRVKKIGADDQKVARTWGCPTSCTGGSGMTDDRIFSNTRHQAV